MQRLARAESPVDNSLSHGVQRFQARGRERVGLEDDIEASDVVQVGSVAGMSADVTGIGRRRIARSAIRCKRSSPESGTGGLPRGRVSERTSATLGIAISLRLDLLDRGSRPVGDRKSSRGLLDQRHGRA